MTLYEVLMTEDIDESIRDVLIRLNMAGYNTKYSCSGAPRDHNIDRKITDTEECADYLLSIEREHMVEWIDGVRCYLVLMINDKKRSVYIKELREKLHGTNWHVEYTFNTSWRRWDDIKRWYNLERAFDRADRVTLEYKCEFSDNICRKAWNTLLEKAIIKMEKYTMIKYNCPKCGAPAPESGGVYNKSYDPKEDKLVYFWFPTYMCEKCELEFIINGARMVKGKLVWQDKNVRREDWDDSDWV